MLTRDLFVVPALLKSATVEPLILAFRSTKLFGALNFGVCRPTD